MSTLPTVADPNANAGPGALAADLVTRCLAIVAVALRFLAKRKGGSAYWWDDWLVLGAAILLIPAIVIEVMMTKLGLGRHLAFVIENSPQNLPLYAKLLYADQLFYSPILAPVKLSILCLYVRLFGVNRKMVILCYIQMVMVIIWALITEMVFIFQCTPIQVAWSPDRAGGTCFDFRKLFIGTNVVNVAMDFGILFTPLHSIWSLQLPTQKKIIVTAILMLGASEAAFSAARLGKVSSLTFLDNTWDSATALIWSTVETAVGILCACIPVLGPLLPRSWLGRVSTSSKPRSTGYGYGDNGYGDIDSGRAIPFSSVNRQDPEIGTDDDEHELVRRGNIMTIKCTTEYEVKNESRTSTRGTRMSPDELGIGNAQ